MRGSPCWSSLRPRNVLWLSWMLQRVWQMLGWQMLGWQMLGWQMLGWQMQAQLIPWLHRLLE